MRLDYMHMRTLSLENALSTVIHAGLYYPTGSLKAQLCVRGKHKLYEYLSQHGIPHRRVTKLVVATQPSQLPRLKALQAQAAANGVSDLVWLSGQEARRLEPRLHAVAALLSPSTGVMDSHTYMASLLADAEAAGASLALRARVEGGVIVAGGPLAGAGFVLDVHDPAAPTPAPPPLRLHTRILVNAAGLWAQHVSRSIIGIPPESIPPQYLARGVYFTLRSATTDSSGQIPAAATPDALPDASSLNTPDVQGAEGGEPFPHDPSGRRPFNRLVYPLPQDGGLGVHLTLDLAGQCRFGPDVEWVDRVDYTVDPGRAATFERAIRTFWPALPPGALQPGYAGVRPKLSGPGQPAADFVIQGPAEHHVPGLVCLYGMESPGLTSSLAVAERCMRALGLNPPSL